MNPDDLNQVETDTQDSISQAVSDMQDYVDTATSNVQDQVTQTVSDAIQSHMHDGLDSQRINLISIFGVFPTITDGTTLTNVLAGTPNSVYGQIFIDTSTATKKLYVYDFVGQKWLSMDGLTTH